MKLPFPIRGTKAWDSRELQRFYAGLEGGFTRHVPNVMSFGHIPQYNSHQPNAESRNKNVEALEAYGVDDEDIEKWASGCCRK